MKKLTCLLLCAVLVLCAACGREVPPTEPSEPTEEPTRAVVEVPMETEAARKKYEGVSLTYWSRLREEDPEARIISQAAADFERTTGAKISISWFGSEAALTEALQGDLQVDIFEMSGEGVSQNLSVVQDLGELAAQAQYEAKSWDVLRQQMMHRWGAVKAIAFRPWLYGLYYNRGTIDALGVESLPSGWQDYLDFCQMLKDNGYECLAIDQEKAHLLLELHMERALGWDGLKETMVNAQWRSNETAATMIQEAINFASAGYRVKGTPAAYPLGQNRLAQSNVLFVAGTNVMCAEVEEATLSDVNWGVMAYPGDGPGAGLLVDADMLAVHTDCENVRAAFDFILLLTTGEYDQLRADVTIGIPADPGNTSPITGANSCMAAATARAPKWFTPDNNELFNRLWNGYYKTGRYFADQLNMLSRNFANEKSVG